MPVYTLDRLGRVAHLSSLSRTGGLVLLHLIDTINEKIGSYTGFLLIVMTFMMTYEVVSRRIFGDPTSWAWSMSTQLQCIIVALAGGYCLLHHAHVRMDALYSRLSPRQRAITDIATFVFVLLVLGVMLWRTTEMGLLSFSLREHDVRGFRPYIWHLKLIIIPGGVLLLLLQELAEFIRSLQFLFRKGQP